MTVRKIKTQTRDALSEYLSQFKFLQRSYSICPYLRTLPINMSGQRRVSSKLKPWLVTNGFSDKSAQQIKWHTAPGPFCHKKFLFGMLERWQKTGKIGGKIEKQADMKYVTRPAAACGSEWNFLTGRRKCGDSGLRDGGAASRR